MKNFLIYKPTRTPSFVAWVSAFSYGAPGEKAEIGVSFDERLEEDNPTYRVPRLELAEAAGIPVSYSSVEAGSPAQTGYRVYLKSADGIHFTESGRCRRSEGAFCNVGFSDGRIVGFDVPRVNAEGDAWADYISVRESTDGGTHWTEKNRLLTGTAPYLWKAKRLSNGNLILLASLYGTPWGAGRERMTRNTQLPDETYISKIQTFFMTGSDEEHLSGPHYILPGIGAHEFDVVESGAGNLLFIAGDVQGTPVGRQFVRIEDGRVINGPLLPIGEGAPINPQTDPQGGIMPETVCTVGDGALLAGYRRNRGFVFSGNAGRDWVLAEEQGEGPFLYQPFAFAPDKTGMFVYGHVGGDNAFGECESEIRGVSLAAEEVPPVKEGTQLTLQRMMNEDNTQYVNAFSCTLSAGRGPVAGAKVKCCFVPFWTEEGTVNTHLLSEAELFEIDVTDAEGRAYFRAKAFDGIPDIHLAYRVQAFFTGDAHLGETRSPEMTTLAMTPKRNDPFPYAAYLAGSVLFLSPAFCERYKEAVKGLNRLQGEKIIRPDVPQNEAEEKLLEAGVFVKDGEGYKVIRCVHDENRLNEIKVMPSGDVYQ